MSNSLWPMDFSPPDPLSMEFSRQEYLSGLPFPSPGDPPDPGIKPGSPALQADSFPSGKPHKITKVYCIACWIIFSYLIITKMEKNLKKDIYMHPLARFLSALRAHLCFNEPASVQTTSVPRCPSMPCPLPSSWQNPPPLSKVLSKCDFLRQAFPTLSPCCLTPL